MSTKGDITSSKSTPKMELNVLHPDLQSTCSKSEKDAHISSIRQQPYDTSVTSLDSISDSQGTEGLPVYDEAAERKLIRKVDVMIVPIIALLYLVCFLDRGNIGNARIAGLEKDLGMNPKSYQFNVLLTSFYIAYTIFEIPCTTLTKIVGPGLWLPTLTFLFGLFSMAMAFVKNYPSAIALRVLLGAAEAGMLPSCTFYLSRWYKKDELVFRIGLYLAAAPGAGAFGGLLASGILRLHHIGSVQSWKMIFLIEGLITMLVGLTGFFALTGSISTARWLTPSEKRFLESRLKSEFVGHKQVVDKTRKTLLWKGMTSTTALACCAVAFFGNVAIQGISVFLPTLVHIQFPSPRYTVIQQQLLTVPPMLVGALGILGFTYMSARTKLRSATLIAGTSTMILGYTLFLASQNLKVRYAACFFVTTGAYSQGALLPAYVAANTNSDTERAGALAIIVFIGNIGGLVSTWTYVSRYAPEFIPGNVMNCAGGVMMVAILASLAWWQRWENVQRDAGKRDSRLDGLTDDEIALLGSDHPDFRFRY